MRYLALGLICLGVYLAMPKLEAKLTESTLVGNCYAAPACAGPKLKWGSTQQYCASIGGHSMEYATGCVSF